MDDFSYNRDKFRDLGKYSKGSFVYDGEIYMSISSTEDEVVRGLNAISRNHPDNGVKIKALENLVVIITDKIIRKHCK
jgi:hypothetical protein